MAGGALVGVATVPPLFRRVAGLWFRLLGQEPPDRLGRDPTFGLRWVTLYTVNWVLYGSAFWGLARSLGVEGGLVDLGSAFAAAYVLGYLAFFAPAGLGVREGFLVVFLQPVVGGPGPAAALAVVARLWMTLVELIPAGAFALAGARSTGREGDRIQRGGSGGSA